MRDESPTKVTFVFWPVIELFHNIMKQVRKARTFVAEAEASANTSVLEKLTSNFAEEDIPFGRRSEMVRLKRVIEIPVETKILNLISKPIIYRAKVKLHGCNGGVSLEGGELKAQSRNIFIDKTDFGQLVFDHEEYFRSLHDPSKHPKLTIFGEYCGPGVQESPVALNLIDHRIYAIFAICIGRRLIVEPTDIEQFMTKGGIIKLPTNIHILPWYGDELILDLTPQTKDDLHSKFLRTINEDIIKIDALDPWVKEVFGVEGPGEGLVLYPVNLMESSEEVEEYKSMDAGVYSLLAFKAKGRTHLGVLMKNSVQLTPSMAEGVQEYVDLMCPNPRLEQGVGELGGYYLSKAKEFGDWVVKDVYKEGKDELEASELEWKQVLPVVRRRAVAWYTLRAEANQ